MRINIRFIASRFQNWINWACLGIIMEGIVGQILFTRYPPGFWAFDIIIGCLVGTVGWFYWNLLRGRL